MERTVVSGDTRDLEEAVSRWAIGRISAGFKERDSTAHCAAEVWSVGSHVVLQRSEASKLSVVVPRKVELGNERD